MDESQKHHAKWAKYIRLDIILFHLYNFLENAEVEIISVCQRLRVADKTEFNKEKGNILAR
jgi:hypothetical protein